MPERILKFKSLNLRGETRKEEKHRILHERIEAIRQGKSRKEINEIGGWRAGLFGFKTSEIKHMDICGHCRKRTEHIKQGGYKMCKNCSCIEKC
jgi:hypothetical protein